MEKMELLIERANEGDVVAMGELGVHYYEVGDYEKAFGLLSSAALQWEEIECDDGNKYNEYTEEMIGLLTGWVNVIFVDWELRRMWIWQSSYGKRRLTFPTV